MRAITKKKKKKKLKKKKLYENGGKTDPPKKGFKDRKFKPGEKEKVRDVTSNIMGLSPREGVRVYSELVESGLKHPPGHPRAGHERYHRPGEMFAPKYNLHTKHGLVQMGRGQITRAKDPTKRGKKGSKGSRPAGKK